MRTGLLTPLLGLAGDGAGVAFLLGPLFLVALVWFVYFGLLCSGSSPGGRPPAWAAGEAIPWPTPGRESRRRTGAREAAGIESDVREPATRTPTTSPAASARKRKQPRVARRRLTRTGRR